MGVLLVCPTDFLEPRTIAHIYNRRKAGTAVLVVIFMHTRPKTDLHSVVSDNVRIFRTPTAPTT